MQLFTDSDSGIETESSIDEKPIKKQPTKSKYFKTGKFTSLKVREMWYMYIGVTLFDAGHWVSIVLYHGQGQ